jgi:tetratricopeptide (TPR) repeat protein
VAGTAGVGKTAIAVQWAHQVAGSFPDGQLYVNLRGYDPEQPMTAAEALARFLRDLGMHGSDIPAEVGERAACYRSLLAGRRMLIVLDNAGQAEHVRPLLPATPGCAAVVTSRDALAGLVARDGARRLDLDLLPVGDAVTLLRALVGERVDQEPDAVAVLVAQCCRLPLALRVAAEMASARPGSSLADLAAELADTEHRLDLLDVGGDPRAAVRTVFSWSIRHLDPDAARAFPILSLHPGPDLDRYAAAALTGTSLRRARQLLALLGRAHLIQPAGPGRYAMHDLLRDYGRELAGTDDRDEERRSAVARLLDYYVHATATAMGALYPGEKHQRPAIPSTATAEPALTEPSAARAWLDTELACLVIATGYAAKEGWPGYAIHLSATLFRYLDAGGHFPEAVTIHGHARAAARQAADAAAEAGALSDLGHAEMRQGLYQDAARHFEQALPLSRQAGDRRSEAVAVSSLGILAVRMRHYEQAADHYELALNLYRETGNRFAEAAGLSNLGGALMRLGRFEQAASYLEQALALCRDTGNQVGETGVLLYLGEVHLRQGRYEKVPAYLERVLDLCRIAGDRLSEASALTGLGEADLRQGRYQQAARRLTTALAMCRDMGARFEETEALSLLGDLALAMGDHAAALLHHGDALSLASTTGDTYWQARAHDGLARIHHAGGRPEQARELWLAALGLYTEMGAPEADQIRMMLTGINLA